MSDDLPLFSKATQELVRRKDPSTSFEAATKVIKKLRPIQIEVLRRLTEAGENGLTDYELEELCGSHGSTFRTRRSELTEAGYIKDSGRKKLLVGSNRIVWVINSTGSVI